MSERIEADIEANVEADIEAGRLRLARGAALLGSGGIPGAMPAHGRVVEAIGTLIKVRGLAARVGDMCDLTGLSSDFALQAEVVGLGTDYALLAPLGSMHGLSTGVAAVSRKRAPEVLVGDALLGRVLDGMGRPMDGLPPIDRGIAQAVYAAPPAPLTRPLIEHPLAVGVRAIDGLLSCGVGQRIGIFAPAGCGKSTLLGMIARNADADVNVVALIGERGREVQEFIHDCLGPEGLRKTVLVVATSDRPALERARAALVATAIAEYFRERGKAVLLLADSVTRYARALREIGLAGGEPPTRRAFPPSVFTALPQLFERAGMSPSGSITAFYTVLEEGEDNDDPIAEEVRSLLDGHIVLSRKLASAGHFPAIDVLASVSRVMPRVAHIPHQRHAARARTLLTCYKDLEMLIRLGEYKPGHDPEADAAVRLHPGLLGFLRQATDDRTPFRECLQRLAEAVQ
ncbi:FliI/YscN family ATPase [Pseudoduganella lutea]|nr:FliI/YscN family ATPase [Pseudoduganella lutea]